MQTYNFVGCHKAVNQKKFSIENTKEFIVLSNRSKTDGRKPQTFIVKIDKEGKRTYISSLFPNNDGTYNFDFLGIKYCATISAESLCCQVRNK
jgi:hypothetical protein